MQHWSRQGETSLTNLVTLCSYHHMLLHEGGYSARWILHVKLQDTDLMFALRGSVT